MRSEVVIETKRLRLRTWNEAYGDRLNTYCNTDEVMEHLGWKQSPAKHRQTVEWLIEQQSDYGITFWVMERKEDDEFLGFCGLIKVDEPDSTVLGATEIGWRLRSDMQGKGYAKEAAVACLRHAFEETDGLRVVSRTVKANVESWGLMQSLGMRHDHRLDYTARGEAEPFVVYVATYEDWKKMKVQLPRP